MKITVNTKELKKGLQTIQRGIATKSTMPILKGVLIKATDSITLVSNNLEIGISTVIQGDIEEEGSVVIPGADLIKYVGKVNTTEITITVDDNYQIELKSKGKYRMSGYNPVEFPEKRKVEEKKLTISQSLLKAALDKTEFAIANDNMRPSLSAVNLILSQNNLGTVGTNTYRLSLFNDFEPEDDEDIKNILLPGLTADTLSKLLDNGDVEIIYDDSYAEFKFNDIIIQSRLVDNSANPYPDYKQIVPKNYALELTVDKEQLQNAVEIAGLTNEEKVISLRVEGDKLTVFGNGSSKNYKEELEIEKTGEDMVTGLDSSYVLDYLKTVDSDIIKIKSVGAMAQWVLSDPNVEESIYIVMPIRS